MYVMEAGKWKTVAAQIEKDFPAKHPARMVSRDIKKGIKGVPVKEEILFWFDERQEYYIDEAAAWIEAGQRT